MLYLIFNEGYTTSSGAQINRTDLTREAIRLASGMAKDPADRPTSARSFVHDLEARAADAYGPRWEDHGRHDLGERAAALLPLLAGKGGNSATATRLARRRMLAFAMIGTTGTVARSPWSRSRRRRCPARPS